jgi:hypothetical protein
VDDPSAPVTRGLRAAALVGAVAFSLAHVGSPDTIFEGQAGPYPVRVIVRTPGVVPGLADIVVRITGGPGGVRHVTVLPVRGGYPTSAEPPPDTARAVAGDANLLSAQLWLMRFGAYSVQVTVTGNAGSGTVIVPVNALATRRLGMNRPMAVGLLALGLFLFVGAVTIVAAAVRESVLEPGQEPDQRRRRRAWMVGAIAVVVLILGLVGGNAWWNAEDRAFQSRIYRPPTAETSVRDGVLRFGFADSVRFRREWTPLVPDHGKLVHLFLIEQRPGPSPVLAHLHPPPLDSTTFQATLPPLPRGTYHLFADIVHENGLTQTVTDTVEIPAPTGEPWRPSDPDDSWSGDGGGTIEWRNAQAFTAGQEVELEFEVPGRTLEPYMGMAGHAVIARDDGSVFIHLHPLGTIATAAQLVYALREQGDTIRGRLGRRITQHASMRAHGSHELASSVRFPYVFPRPGRYDVWVQVRSGGRILTAGFQAEVN